MKKMDAKDCWKQFCQLHPQENRHYEVWGFGDSAEMANQLGKLVLDGIKTATASCHALYEWEDDPLPKKGDYNIILDGDKQALCITQTADVSLVPFDQVSGDQAWREGEGDRSLNYWRKVHEEFFTKELAEEGLTFNSNMLIVCEKFRVVFRPGKR